MAKFNPFPPLKVTFWTHALLPEGGGEGGKVAAIAQLHQLVLKGGEKKQLAGYSKYTLYNQHEELHTVSRNSEKFLKVADANLYISYIWKNYLKYKFENYIFGKY